MNLTEVTTSKFSFSEEELEIKILSGGREIWKWLG